MNTMTAERPTPMLEAQAGGGRNLPPGTPEAAIGTPEPPDRPKFDPVEARQRHMAQETQDRPVQIGKLENFTPEVPADRAPQN